MRRQPRRPARVRPSFDFLEHRSLLSGGYLTTTEPAKVFVESQLSTSQASSAGLAAVGLNAGPVPGAVPLALVAQAQSQRVLIQDAGGSAPVKEGSPDFGSGVVIESGTQPSPGVVIPSGQAPLLATGELPTATSQTQSKIEEVQTAGSGALSDSREDTLFAVSGVAVLAPQPGQVFLSKQGGPAGDEMAFAVAGIPPFGTQVSGIFTFAPARAQPVLLAPDPTVFIWLDAGPGGNAPSSSRHRLSPLQGQPPAARRHDLRAGWAGNVAASSANLSAEFQRRPRRRVVAGT